MNSVFGMRVYISSPRIGFPDLIVELSIYGGFTSESSPYPRTVAERLTYTDTHLVQHFVDVSSDSHHMRHAEIFSVEFILVSAEGMLSHGDAHRADKDSEVFHPCG